MAAEKENAAVSDTEGGERPVREQLKKAHIRDQNASKADPDLDADVPDAPEETSEAVADTSNGEKAAEQQRGRLHRKRSYEEVEVDSPQPSTSAKPHTRKRSRDSTTEENALNNGQRKSGERPRNGEETGEDSAESNGTNAPRPATPEQKSEDAVEALASPKTKRSRLLSTTVDADAEVPADSTSTTSGKTSAESADSKKEQPAAKIPAGSAFGNTSSASPFGALAGSKSPPSEAQTSSSTFASSGFGSLAATSSAGFGALGKTSGGPGLGGGFGSGGKSPLNTHENDAPSAGSAFGGGLGQKSVFSSGPSSSTAFGSGTSGFSTLGGGSSSGFGSTLGGGLGGSGFGTLGGGGLSSFARGKAPTLSGAKSAKAFGAPTDNDEEDADDVEEDDKSGMKSPLSQEADKQDERFYAQDLETGEEDEDVEFNSRAKVYNWAASEDGKKEWRERGVGTLRLNVKKATEGGKPTARLLMRADGSHRVVLNTPVKKEIKFGTPTGEQPQGGYLFFSGTIDGKATLELLQLKLRQVNALELWDKINALQETM